jgi:hypothetical protein
MIFLSLHLLSWQCLIAFDYYKCKNHFIYKDLKNEVDKWCNIYLSSSLMTHASAQKKGEKDIINIFFHTLN